MLKKIRAGSPNAAHAGHRGVDRQRPGRSIDQCTGAGANAYHVKPVRRAELVATVKAQLAARAKPQSVR